MSEIVLPCHITFDAETGEILAASCDVGEILRALGGVSVVGMGLAAEELEVVEDGTQKLDR